MDVNLLPDDLKKEEEAERARIAREAGVVPMSDPLKAGQGVPGKSLGGISSPSSPSIVSAPELPRLRERSYIQPGQNGGNGAGRESSRPAPQTLPATRVSAVKPKNGSFFSRLFKRVPPPIPKTVSGVQTPPPIRPTPVASTASTSALSRSSALSLPKPVSQPVVIPKQPLQPARITQLPSAVVVQKLSTHQREWLAIGVGLLVLGLIALVMAPRGAQMLAKMNTDWQKERIERNRQLQALSGAELQYQDLQRRAPIILRLLQEHKSLSVGFSFLESTVLPTVQYTSATILADGLLLISGQAASGTDVSQQVAALRSLGGVKTVVIENLQVASPSSNATFTLRLNLQPELLKYVATQ